MDKPTHHSFKDIEGQTFGRITVLRVAERRRKAIYWHCRCVCGTEFVLRGSCLIRGQTTMCSPCGKKSSVTHGSRYTVTYRTFSKMRERCNNPNAINFADYGGRGVKVCERWNNFENFLADMGERPSPKHSLDRIDVNGDYEPDNCRWATKYVQANNTRSNRFVTWKGETKTVSEWARELNMQSQTLARRLNAGWSVEDAFTQPLRKRKK